jgi:NADH-quinone oxidoreductase subunit G
MPKLTIDGIQVEVEPGTTVLQACEQAGIEVPRFCYHERLSIAGNCRMCLVEQEKAPKPIASCAMPVMDNMVIKTDTPMVQKARKGVMEFLLINHPLDCPICDQGGECDLQDQAMGYGMDHSRFQENKRAVKDKEFGPLVKTVMTRCIHCTRCIRFATEIAGVEELGATGRGEGMEIGTYVEKALSSELSGNLVDICPVGALTSKPYAFAARPWELRKTETIDVMDAVGSNIRVDTRGREVMRVLPRVNEQVNEEWIADKTRHAVDGLRRQRLDTPYVRTNGKLQPVSWGAAFEAIAAKLKGAQGGRIAALAGDLCDAESMFALKLLMQSLGSPNLDCRQDGAKIGGGARGDYLFNSTIAGVERADAILLVGSNPRWEAPIINARIRKRWLAGGLKIGRIGPAVNLTYRVDHIGAGPESLSQLIDARHPFVDVLKGAKHPMIIVGMGALARPDGAAVMAAVRRLGDAIQVVRDGWNGFNVLHTAAARVAGLDMGFLPGPGGKERDGILGGGMDVVYLLGADEVDTSRLGNAFVIYQGHHGDRGAHRADAILPGAAYTEKDGTYVNTEGRVQRALRASFPPGEAREDWAILRALSEALGKPLPFDDISQLRRKLNEAVPGIMRLGQAGGEALGPAPSAGTMDNTAFASPIADYYLTDPISRASETMAECSRLFVKGGALHATGTHG